MEKQMIKHLIRSLGFRRVALVIGSALPLIISLNAYAQNPPAAPAPGAPPPTGATAEAERVIVTGSNIPTAEEVGPNPVT
ncbi:MAG: hypothetical protein DME45_08650, partial [Verrucomicrobia bacterium]